MFKVYEVRMRVKDTEEMNDRYYENYDSAWENFEYRIKEMRSSRYYIEDESVDKSEFVYHKQDSIQNMHYVYSKLDDGSIQMIIVILEKVESRRS